MASNLMYFLSKHLDSVVFIIGPVFVSSNVKFPAKSGGVSCDAIILTDYQVIKTMIKWSKYIFSNLIIIIMMYRSL